MTEPTASLDLITDTVQQLATAKAEVRRLETLLLSWRDQLKGIRRARKAPNSNGKPKRKASKTSPRVPGDRLREDVAALQKGSE